MATTAKKSRPSWKPWGSTKNLMVDAEPISWQRMQQNKIDVYLNHRRKSNNKDPEEEKELDDSESMNGSERTDKNAEKTLRRESREATDGSEGTDKDDEKLMRKERRRRTRGSKSSLPRSKSDRGLHSSSSHKEMDNSSRMDDSSRMDASERTFTEAEKLLRRESRETKKWKELDESERVDSGEGTDKDDEKLLRRERRRRTRGSKSSLNRSRSDLGLQKSNSHKDLRGLRREKSKKSLLRTQSSGNLVAGAEASPEPRRNRRSVSPKRTSRRSRSSARIEKGLSQAGAVAPESDRPSRIGRCVSPIRRTLSRSPSSSGSSFPKTTIKRSCSSGSLPLSAHQHPQAGAGTTKSPRCLRAERAASPTRTISLSPLPDSLHSTQQKPKQIRRATSDAEVAKSSPVKPKQIRRATSDAEVARTAPRRAGNRRGTSPKRGIPRSASSKGLNVLMEKPLEVGLSVSEGVSSRDSSPIQRKSTGSQGSSDSNTESPRDERRYARYIGLSAALNIPDVPSKRISAPGARNNRTRSLSPVRPTNRRGSTAKLLRMNSGKNLLATAAAAEAPPAAA